MTHATREHGNIQSPAMSDTSEGATFFVKMLGDLDEVIATLGATADDPTEAPV